MTAKNKIIIFADGSSLGNPGPGGWGAIVLREDGIIELGGSEEHATNNRMELTAAIRALEEVGDAREKIVLHTDSSYVVSGMTKWIYGWQKNNWRTQTDKDVLNRDLWERLVSLARGKNIEWKYVSGHSGIAGNERADQIARTCAEKGRTELYRGNVSHYKIDITDVSGHPEKQAARKQDRAHSRAKAYSYVSMVDGKIQTHAAWAECEKRVKGVAGAKFKKATSAAEEQSIVAGWRTK